MTEQDDANGLHQDSSVEAQRPVLDVVQVVAHLLGFLLDVVRVAQTDLRPASNARTNGRPKRVIGNLLAKALHVGDRVRPGPDKIHESLALLDTIEQLRQHLSVDGRLVEKFRVRRQLERSLVEPVEI